VSERRQVILASVTIGLVAAATVGLAVRLCYIQLVLRPKLLAWTAKQQQGTITLPARRGLILDRRGRLLAGSEDCPSAFADPGLIREPETTAARLGPILGIHPAELSSKLSARGGRRFVWLRRYLDEAQAQAIERLNLRGIGLIQEPRRRYPMGSLFAHVIGFVGTAQNGRLTGLEGIERRFDEVLAGQPGSARIICDVRRRAVWSRQDGTIPPRDGAHVVLTVDATIQQIVQRELAATIAQFRAQDGLAVVMAPQTGEVLAMACLPGFEPDHYADFAASIRRNRVLTDPVEPGSTFKPFVAAAALAEGVVRLDETIFCHNGLYVVGGRRLHDHHPYGNLRFGEILIKSSNIGMAILARRLGNDRLYKYLRAFGFGSKTGIEMPGESPGIVPPPRRWSAYSAMSIAFGQEIAVTPLQLLTAFCAIVNDGVLVRPRIVRAVVSPAGKLLEDRTAPSVAGRVLPSRVARTIAKILADVVDHGTGRRAALAGYRVLGKTGTAQIPYRSRPGYEPDAYLSSFLGAAPAENPRIAVLVMIRRPRPELGYYGGTVAAPTVGRILAATLAYLRVPPDKPQPDLTCVRWPSR